MTRHEAPGYYFVTDTPDEQPSTDDCVEGRLFIADDRLVCGVGKMGGMGYADALDAYSESTVRRLFGNRFDPQEVDLDTTLQQDATVVVPLSAVASADLRQWDGSRRRGAEHTFAVAVRAPSALDSPLLLQLGRGERNRGTGRTRHESLARWLDGVADGTASDSETDASATDAGTGASPTESDDSTAASDDSTATPAGTGVADSTDADGPAAADREPSTAEPQPADAAPDAASGALADVARSTPVGSPDQSAPATDESTADPVESDAESTPSAATTQGSADAGADASTTSEPAAADSGEEDPADAAPAPDPGDEDADEAADTDSEDADPDPEPTWLDEEPDAPALIVKNRSDIRLRPRVRCRHEGEVLFLDDLDLEPGDTRRWTDFPEEGMVHLDILFDDGSRKAEQLDERHLRSPPVGIDLHASGAEVHPAE